MSTERTFVTARCPTARLPNTTIAASKASMKSSAIGSPTTIRNASSDARAIQLGCVAAQR